MRTGTSILSNDKYNRHCSKIEFYIRFKLSNFFYIILLGDKQVINILKSGFKVNIIIFSEGTAKGLPLSAGSDAAFDTLFAG